MKKQPKKIKVKIKGSDPVQTNNIIDDIFSMINNNLVDDINEQVDGEIKKDLNNNKETTSISDIVSYTDNDKMKEFLDNKYPSNKNWNDIKSNPPEINKSVLACIENNDSILIGKLKDDGHFYNSFTGYMNDDVTHWQELPCTYISSFNISDFSQETFEKNEMKKVPFSHIYNKLYKDLNDHKFISIHKPIENPVELYPKKDKEENKWGYHQRKFNFNYPFISLEKDKIDDASNFINHLINIFGADNIKLITNVTDCNICPFKGSPLCYNCDNRKSKS